MHLCAVTTKERIIVRLCLSVYPYFRPHAQFKKLLGKFCFTGLSVNLMLAYYYRPNKIITLLYMKLESNFIGFSEMARAWNKRVIKSCNVCLQNRPAIWELLTKYKNETIVSKCLKLFPSAYQATTSTSKQVFSTLRRVWTYLRSTTAPDTSVCVCVRACAWGRVCMYACMYVGLCMYVVLCV
jgi:hypothetical protein